MILGIIIGIFIGGGLGVAYMCLFQISKDRDEKPETKIPTPHGNLIDREDLLEKLALFREEIGDNEYNFVVCVVTGAGVIVEAEEKE